MSGFANIPFRIELRRGLKADLPTSPDDALLAEPFFCEDTGELFIWKGSEMVNVSGAAMTYVQAQVAAEAILRAAGDSSAIATAETYADTKIAALINSAPGALDTLKELADAMGDDANFAASVSTSLASEAATRSSADVALAATIPQILGTPDLGKIPIGQGDGTAVYSDPLVQGLNVESSAASLTKPVLVSGKGADGNQHDIATDNAGQVKIIATALPLPAGAATDATLASIDGKTPALVSGAVPVAIPAGLATSAKQDTGNTSIASIDTKIPASPATTGKQDTGNTSLASIDTKTPALSAGKVPVTDPTALPLPAGASTEATLALIKAKTDNLDVALSTRTKPADTQAVSAATLPLPTGASTETTLALIKAKTDNLDVALSTRTKPGDTQPVSAASLPLPTGASTSAKQDTGNTSLASIDTKLTGVAADGTDQTGVAVPTGAVGIRGWLSAIYNVLKNGVLGTNNSQWGGATLGAAIADAPVGTEIAPVVRSISRKKTIIETSTPLTANSVFTGAWHDSELDGTVQVVATKNADQASAANGFVIQESDDTANAALTRTVVQAASATGFSRLASCAIKARYWRVVYTNGASNQTVFELTTCASNAFNPWVDNSTNATPGASGSIIAVVGSGIATAPFDNVANANLTTPIQAYNASGGTLQVISLVFGGSFSGSADAARQNWSRPRTSTVFRQANLVSGSSTNKVAIWTPGSSNKFRLLKLKVIVSGGVIIGSAQEVTLTLYDNVTAMPIVFTFWVPTAGQVTDRSFDFDLGSFGILSAAANNALQAAVGTAITGGTISIIAMGTEE